MRKVTIQQIKNLTLEVIVKENIQQYHTKGTINYLKLMQEQVL